MNSFTDRQLEVIEQLARSYHQVLNRNWTDDFITPEIRKQLENSYVQAITAGLKDPDYWKDYK